MQSEGSPRPPARLKFRALLGHDGGVTTTTKTLERTGTDVREDTSSGIDDGTPKFFHYVKKDQIVDSAISGKMVVALCGETFPVKKQAKPGSPVCPKCEAIYKGLRRK